MEGIEPEAGVSERLLVLTTVARAEDAERIAEALVGSRLAACVNVLPGVRSSTAGRVPWSATRSGCS